MHESLFDPYIEGGLDILAIANWENFVRVLIYFSQSSKPCEMTKPGVSNFQISYSPFMSQFLL